MGLACYGVFHTSFYLNLVKFTKKKKKTELLWHEGLQESIYFNK